MGKKWPPSIDRCGLCLWPSRKSNFLLLTIDAHKSGGYIFPVGYKICPEMYISPSTSDLSQSTHDMQYQFNTMTCLWSDQTCRERITKNAYLLFDLDPHVLPAASCSPLIAGGEGDGKWSVDVIHSCLWCSTISTWFHLKEKDPANRQGKCILRWWFLN